MRVRMPPVTEPLAYANAIEDLRLLNARFIQNYINNDVAGHEEILHRRFLYVNGSGARIDRATYLDQWRTGFDPNVVVYWDTRDELITLIGDVALVRATNKYVICRGTHQEVGMATYTDTYLFDDGAWKCIQAQITPVMAGNEPDDETIISVYLRGVLQTSEELPAPDGPMPRKSRFTTQAMRTFGKKI